MRKIIIGFLVVFMLAIVGITVYFVKIVYYTNNDNKVVVREIIETTAEETIKKPKPIGGEKVEEYVDEYGMKITKYSDGTEYADYPEDVTTWSMQSKDIREMVIHDAMRGREWGLREYPITDNYFDEWHRNGWDNTEVLFPGYKKTKEYNFNDDFALYIDDFKKEDKEGIAHAVIRSKYYKMRYDFKYYLDDDYKLDKIEYISQEIYEDCTKEVEKKERIYLMIKEGNEIHKDNEYITVLWNFSDSINMTDFSLERMGIVDELKEKKYKENVLPISYDVSYDVHMNKDYAYYDKKEAEVFIRYWESDKCEKYIISFDYNENYYLTKYEVLNRVDITLEEYKKISVPLS